MSKSYFRSLAPIFAIIAFAFSEVKTAPLPTCSSPKKWFAYIGPPFPGTAIQSDLLNPSNYLEITEQRAEFDCVDVDYLCAICAFEEGTFNRPVMDPTLQSQLFTYFQSGGTAVASSIIEKP